MYSLSQSNLFALDMVQVFLHMYKYLSFSGEVDCHELQRAQDTVPLIHTNTILSAGYVGESFPEAGLSVWR